MRSGYCRQINEDGSCYVGGFYKNKKEGFGTLYDTDFKILMQGQWVDDIFIIDQ